MIPLEHRELTRVNREDKSCWGFTLNTVLSASAPEAQRGREGSCSHPDSSSVPSCHSSGQLRVSCKGPLPYPILSHSSSAPASNDQAL